MAMRSPRPNPDPGPHSLAGPTDALPIDGWAGTQEWVAQHPNTAAAFQRAVAKAQRLAATDRAELAEVVPLYTQTPKQVVMTNHLVDGIFIAISDKAWKAMTPAQRQKVQAAADAAAAFNNEGRIREEGQLVEFLKQQGLQVTTPDLDAFRSTVQAAYMASEFAKQWPKGMLERINNTR